MYSCYLIISEKQYGFVQKSAMAKAIGGHSDLRSGIAMDLAAIPMASSMLVHDTTSK